MGNWPVSMIKNPNLSFTSLWDNNGVTGLGYGWSTSFILLYKFVVESSRFLFGVPQLLQFLNCGNDAIKPCDVISLSLTLSLIDLRTVENLVNTLWHDRSACELEIFEPRL